MIKDYGGAVGSVISLTVTTGPKTLAPVDAPRHLGEQPSHLRLKTVLDSGSVSFFSVFVT